MYTWYLTYTWCQYQTKTSQGKKKKLLQTSISYEHSCKILQKDSYKQNPAAYKNYTLWPSRIYLFAKNARLVHRIRVHEYNQFSCSSCPTLCDPIDWSMPGFPVRHQLPELTQTHVHHVGDAILSSVVPFSSCLQSFPALGSFPMSQFFASGGQSIGLSASASVLPVNIQDWFPLGLLVGSPCSPRDSQVFSNTTVQKHHLFGAQLSLLSNSHIHTWLLKNHSFDYMDLCWKSNVSTF